MKQVNNKYFPLVLLFILCASTVFPQRKIPNNRNYDRKPYHFGFSLGINEMDFTLNRKENFLSDFSEEGIRELISVEAIPEKGFNVGIVTNLRLNENSDLRFVPNLAFGDRRIAYLYRDSAGVLLSEEKKIESTYVEFPFLFKYKGIRLLNYRPYIIGGLKYTMDLASQAKKKDKDDNVKDLVKIKRDDIACEVGFGSDFYLTYFKFAVELKMSYGLSNILKQEPSLYSNSIDRLHSKIFMITFLFE